MQSDPFTRHKAIFDYQPHTHTCESPSQVTYSLRPRISAVQAVAPHMSALHRKVADMSCKRVEETLLAIRPSFPLLLSCSLTFFLLRFFVLWL